jgi:hypothetical protein
MFDFFVENPLYLIPLLIIFIIFAKKYIDYAISSYHKVTKYSYFETFRDKGKYGEYLTYKYLREMEKKGAKILFNLYIPKPGGGTAEIDILMLCSKGIFVFESKNYSGWIFGREHQQDWYQTLPAGSGKTCNKEKFYNPIKQNATHIKALKGLVADNIPIWSIVVFSERCTLKDIEITSDNVSVINRYNVKKEINSIYRKDATYVLSKYEIVNLYNKLYPYTQVGEGVKRQHIENIKRYRNEREQNHQNTKLFKERTQEKGVKKCPLCNGSLILKTAAKGTCKGNQFYGCSNYPKCGYIENLTKNSNPKKIKNEIDEFFG